MPNNLKKLARKAGVLLRGGWRPVADRRRLQKSEDGPMDPEAIKKAGYHGQYGQDQWVVENIYFGDLLPEFLYQQGYRLAKILRSDKIYVRA